MNLIKEEETHKKLEDIPFHDDVDISKYVDVTTQERIAKQLEGIDNQVEEMGKVCDKIYKNSYEDYKNLLDKERDSLDKGIKTYIRDLRENLTNLRDRINFDYKRKYRDVNNQLNTLIDDLKKTTEENVKLQFLKDNLEEDSDFYEKQIDNIRDMNIYLKYKIKLFLGDIKEVNEKEKSKEKIESREEIVEDKKEKKDKKSDNNKIKKINEINIDENKEKKEDEEKKNNKKNNTEEKTDQKLLITSTNLFKSKKNSNKRYGSRKKELDLSDTQYLYTKLDLEESQLKASIIQEQEKFKRLKELYIKLYQRASNPYLEMIKNVIDEHKSTNSSKVFDKSGSNNQSALPSIYQNTSQSTCAGENSSNFYSPQNPGPGYMSRMENKEIILRFLEKPEIKKVIYTLMYDKV